MGHSAVLLTINRPVTYVFAIYTHPDTWYWSDLRSVRWTRGKPWEVDSRLRIEPADNFGVIIDQVLTHFEANRRVDFISHFGGVTLLSQLHFRALSDNSTEIRCELEFVGTFSRVRALRLGRRLTAGRSNSMRT